MSAAELEAGIRPNFSIRKTTLKLNKFALFTESQLVVFKGLKSL